MSFAGSLEMFLKEVVAPEKQLGAYMSKLEKVAMNRWAAPFNMMLIDMQREGAGPSFTPTKWARYNRKVKMGAQPLISLRPFGPVDFVFEYRDTEPMPGFEDRKWELKSIIDDVSATQSVAGAPERFDREAFKIGVRLESAHFGINMGGRAMRSRVDAPAIKEVPIKNDPTKVHVYQLPFLVQYSDAAEKPERFHTLIHEFAHVLLGHLGPLRADKEIRWDVHQRRRMNISSAVAELEAESVAFLVCERMGVQARSVEYVRSHLEKHLGPNGELPREFEPDNVLKVAGMLENFINGTLKPASGLHSTRRV